ncbi:MAG: hypothetical protein UHX00_08450, partial [Caryophanon sp.]|nr:hypothetical protein [Caryophanon sp.]
EGKNTATIAVTYAGDDQVPIQVSTTYAITLNVTDVILNTTLTNTTTDEETLRFTASAMQAGEQVALHVTLNGETLKALAGKTYRADLQLGDNTIVLSAGNTEETYTITRTREDATIVIHTDLTDQKVSVPAFTFMANATQNDDDIDNVARDHSVDLFRSSAPSFAIT